MAGETRGRVKPRTADGRLIGVPEKRGTDMSTLISSAARVVPAGRRALAVALPLLAAGALAAVPTVTPVPTPPPVPTVSGGRVVAGEPACAGWPTGATSVSLPVSFVPVSVERCVNGVEAIPGKGLWTTATLERADSGLAGLIDALR